MNHVPDWNRRKYEIGTAFRKEAHLPHEADHEVYEAVLKRVGVTGDHDMRVMISILQDAIMMARRDERPAIPLETFRDWLMWKLVE